MSEVPLNANTRRQSASAGPSGALSDCPLRVLEEAFYRYHPRLPCTPPRTLKHGGSPHPLARLQLHSFVMFPLGFGFGVWNLGFGVSGFGFRVSGFGFRVSGLGVRVEGLGFRVWGVGFRVLGLGFRV